MAKEAPERIWLDAVDCCCERLGSGSYYEGQPSIASIVYIREDLATCTPEERAVIDAALAYVTTEAKHIEGDTFYLSDELIKLQQRLLSAASSLAAAKLK